VATATAALGLAMMGAAAFRVRGLRLGR